MQNPQLFETKKKGERTLKIVRLGSNNVKEIRLVVFFFFLNPALDVSFPVKVFGILIQSFVSASSLCSCRSCNSNITT